MDQKLINCFTWLANTLAQGNTYKNWSDEFVREEMGSAFNKFYDEIKNENLIDFNNLTREEAVKLRFGNWEDDLMLIPLYLLPLIPKGTELTCIDNTKIVYEGPDSIDTDIRFGCLSYGIIIPK